MADTDWDASLAFVFSVEGGYTDDPMDPGGATNLGITLDELSVWRHTAVTKADVQNLQRDEAGAIYRTNYWNASRCVDLAPGSTSWCSTPPSTPATAARRGSCRPPAAPAWTGRSGR